MVAKATSAHLFRKMLRAFLYFIRFTELLAILLRKIRESSHLKLQQIEMPSVAGYFYLAEEERFELSLQISPY